MKSFAHKYDRSKHLVKEHHIQAKKKHSFLFLFRSSPVAPFNSGVLCMLAAWRPHTANPGNYEVINWIVRTFNH